MSSYKITLIGLERGLNINNDSLFTDMDMPSGIDKELLINRILMKANEFELLYSDPIYLKSMIFIWSKTWYKTFERWQQTLTEEYNPIHNYDRYEEWTDDNQRSGKINTKGESSGDNKNKNETSVDGDLETTTGRAAYNSSTYENQNKEVVDDNRKTTSEGSGEYKDKNSSDTTTSDNAKNKHSGHLFGNIGVTTSAAMASEEIRLRYEHNLYNMIADVFMKEFCIMVY